jgi:very-short-patch-repair endonuclease
MREGENRAFARRLRRRSTEAENRLWFHLRGRRLLGQKFQRQKTVGPFIVDFCYHESGLIVELDGGQHAAPEQEEKDRERTAYLNQKGYRMMRFWDHEVLRDSGVVLNQIVNSLKDKTSPHPNPLPQAGEGITSIR